MSANAVILSNFPRPRWLSQQRKLATNGQGKFDLGPKPCVHSPNHSVCRKKVLWDMARENAHFQQHAWGYKTLPLVKTFCYSIGFRAANRLRVDMVRTPAVFLCSLDFVLRVKWQGSQNRTKKIDYIDECTPKRHRNTSKGSLLYLCSIKKGKCNGILRSHTSVFSLWYNVSTEARNATPTLKWESKLLLELGTPVKRRAK